MKICFDAWLLLPIAQVGGFAVLCTEAAAGSCLPALEWNTWNTLSVADGNRLSVRNGRKTGYAGYLYSGGMQGGALRVGQMDGRNIAVLRAGVSHRSRKSGISGIWRIRLACNFFGRRSLACVITAPQRFDPKNFLTEVTMFRLHTCSVVLWKAEKSDRVRMHALLTTARRSKIFARRCGARGKVYWDRKGRHWSAQGKGGGTELESTWLPGCWLIKSPQPGSPRATDWYRVQTRAHAEQAAELGGANLAARCCQGGRGPGRAGRQGQISGPRLSSPAISQLSVPAAHRREGRQATVSHRIPASADSQHATYASFHACWYHCSILLTHYCRAVTDAHAHASLQNRLRPGAETFACQSRSDTIVRQPDTTRVEIIRSSTIQPGHRTASAQNRSLARNLELYCRRADFLPKYLSAQGVIVHTHCGHLSLDQNSSTIHAFYLPCSYHYHSYTDHNCTGTEHRNTS